MDSLLRRREIYLYSYPSMNGQSLRPVNSNTDCSGNWFYFSPLSGRTRDPIYIYIYIHIYIYIYISYINWLFRLIITLQGRFMLDWKPTQLYVWLRILLPSKQADVPQLGNYYALYVGFRLFQFFSVTWHQTAQFVRWALPYVGGSPCLTLGMGLYIYI